jgi:hypothetical protein
MTLIIDLPELDVTLLNARATAEGLSAEQCARQLLQRSLASPTPRQPLPARIRELLADMPGEVRAKHPADGASQHDHYIYGGPQKDQ